MFKSIFTKLPRGLVIVTAVYWVIFFLTQPIYDRSFHDDFAYILSVRHLVIDGYFKVTEWTAVSLISQIFWGALFTFFLGFSIKTLIISTVVAFYFGLIAFYFTLKEFGLSDFISTAFTLVLLAFPWNLLFAYSFMTDIPFMSTLVIAFYFYEVGLKRNSTRHLLLASVFVCIGYLIRQTSIFLSLSVIFVLLLKGFSEGRIFKYRKHILYSATLPIIIFIGYFLWLRDGTNKTLGQAIALDRGLIYALNNYFWPKNISSIGTVSRYYSETLNRVGVYLVQIAGLIWPVILAFSVRRSLVKKFFKKQFVFLSALCLIVILFILFVPPYSKIILPGFEDVYFPRELMYFSAYFGPFDLVWYRNFWDKSVLFSLPFITIGLCALLLWYWRTFLKWKRRINVSAHLRILLISLGAILLSFLTQFKKASHRYPEEDVFSQMWFFYFTIAITIAAAITIFAGVSIKKFDWLKAMRLLLLVSFASIFTWTLILPYVWFEYVISFIPFIVILLALAANSFGFGKIRIIAIVSFLIFISFINAKSANTVLGSVWRSAERLVERGVDPRNIETYQFAWYPWWYYEEDFDKKLKEYGGDKYKIPRLKTWEDPKLEERTYTVVYIKNASDCGSNAILSQKIKTLFMTGMICATNP